MTEGPVQLAGWLIEKANHIDDMIIERVLVNAEDGERDSVRYRRIARMLGEYETLLKDQDR